MRRQVKVREQEEDSEGMGAGEEDDEGRQAKEQEETKEEGEKKYGEVQKERHGVLPTR